jgi:hypothetical protein
MKYFLFFLFIFVACFPSSADSFQLKGVNYPPPDVEIVWSAPTNDLPYGLWIYKVIPQNYSMAVISNAMAVGSFQMRDIIDPRNTNMICFQDKKDSWRKRLKIIPSEGRMEYLDQWESKEIPEGVPNEEEAAKLAMNYLFLLGVDRSQIINKPYIHSDIEIRSKKGLTTWEGTCKCSVRFERRIDGLRAIGGNFDIVFGSHAIVRSFDLSWQNLLPYESHPIANGNGIISYIKNGKAVLPVPEFDFSQLSQTKILTVTKITPCYFYEPTGDGLLHPLAELEMIADLGNTNFNFQLRCPILSTNIVKP